MRGGAASAGVAWAAKAQAWSASAAVAGEKSGSKAVGVAGLRAR